MDEIYEYNGQRYSRAQLIERYGDDKVDAAIAKLGMKRIEDTPAQPEPQEVSQTNTADPNKVYEYNGDKYSREQLEQKYGEKTDKAIAKLGMMEVNAPEEVKAEEAPKEEPVVYGPEQPVKKKDTATSTSADQELESATVPEQPNTTSGTKELKRAPEGIDRTTEVVLEGNNEPSTVLMGSHGDYSPPDADGKFVAFPTLFPKDPKNQTSDPKDWIVAESEDQAYEIAKERGEVLYFDTPEEANKVAKGSWKTPIKSEVENKQPEALTWKQSVSNSYDNFMNSLDGVIPRLNLVAADTYENILGKDLAASFYDYTNPESLAESRRKAIEDLQRLDNEVKQTEGIVQNLKEGDVVGFTAGAIDAVAQLGSSAIPGVLSFGAGFFTETVGRSIHDYNSTKAERLGVTTQELYDSEQAEFGVPATMGVISGALEKVGWKGTTNLINKKIQSEGLKKGLFFFQNANKEGLTEWVQTGTETFNVAIAEGLDAENATKKAVDKMFSEEGLESYAVGVVGSGVMGGAGRGVKKLLPNKNVQEKIDKNAKQKEELKKVAESEGLSEDSKKAVNETIEAIDNENKEIAKEVINRLQAVDEKDFIRLHEVDRQQKKIAADAKSILQDPELSDEAGKAIYEKKMAEWDKLQAEREELENTMYAPKETPQTNNEVEAESKEKPETSNKFVKVNKEGNNTPATNLENRVIDKVIQKGIDRGDSAEKIYADLLQRKFAATQGVQAERVKDYIQDRIDGKTEVKPGEEISKNKQIDEVEATETPKVETNETTNPETVQEETPTPETTKEGVEPIKKDESSNFSEEDKTKYNALETEAAEAIYSNPERATEINKELNSIRDKYGLDDQVLSHGTPHDFDKFETEKIGTGEGNQAFGWGLYFTESGKIAENYAKKLSEDNEGNIYEVKIKAGKRNNWLEWREDIDDSYSENIDKSLTEEERNKYQEYLDNIQDEKEYSGALELFLSGESTKPVSAAGIYNDLADAFGQKRASEIMIEAGIDGVKYKSNAGKGQDFNYVVFNPETIEITNKKKAVPTQTEEQPKAKPTTKEVKVGKGTFTVETDAEGKQRVFKKDGTEVKEFVQRKLRGKKTKGKTATVKNANYSKIIAEANGEMTENQINEERENKVRSILENVEFDDAETLVMKAFVEGERINRAGVEDLIKEKGGKSMWATGMKKEKNLPSIEGLAHKLWEQYGNEYGIDTMQFRNAIEAVVKDYSNIDQLKEYFLDIDTENREKMEQQQMAAAMSSLSEEQIAILEAEMFDESIDELSDAEKVILYKNEFKKTIESLSEEEQQQYFDTFNETKREGVQSETPGNAVSSEGTATGKESREANQEVKQLFEVMPKLSKIGTPEQYQEYIQTIFPDSKVKDIVYHGGLAGIETFDNSKQVGNRGTFHFTSGIDEAIQYAEVLPMKDAYLDQEADVYFTVLNITNPKKVKKFYTDGSSKAIDGKNNDGLIGTTLSNNTEYVVFNPEQIHILGSKKDQKGFKDHVKAKSENKSDINFSKNSTLDQIIDNLDKASQELDKFGKENLGMNLPVAVAKVAIDAMKMAALTVKTTAEVIEAGVKAVKNTTWFKNLSKSAQKDVENNFESYLNRPFKNNPDKTRAEIETEIDELLDEGKSEAEVMDNFNNRREKMIAQDYLTRNKEVTEEQARKQVEDSFKKADETINKKKSAREKINKAFGRFMVKTFDRQYLPKRLLLKAGGKVVRNYIIAAKGASGYAKSLYDAAYDKIYKGLTSTDRKTLDKIIQVRRFIAIDENRRAQNKPNVVHPDFINDKVGKAYLDSLKKELGEKKFKDLQKRADAYFSEFKGLLDKMYESGIISKRSRDEFFDIDYQPRQFLAFLKDAEGEVNMNDANDRNSSGGLKQEQIKKLEDGLDDSLIYDSQYLLSRAINVRAKSIAMNNTNNKLIEFMREQASKIKKLKEQDKLSKKQKEQIKHFEELQKRIKDNPIIKLKDGKPVYKYDKIPKGFERVVYYKQGVKHEFFMEAKMHEQYFDVSKGLLSNPDVKEKAAMLSGTALVKSLATGNNPTFFISNTPRDLMFIATFSDEYGSNVALNLAKVIKDTFKGVRDIKNKNNTFQNFVKYGGMMDFLHQQGDVTRNGTLGKLTDKIAGKKTQDGFKSVFRTVTLEKLQMYSEIGFRMAVFNRSINNQLKEIGVKDINDIQDQTIKDDIYTNAVASARSTTDFNQGGTVTKDLDAFIPYLNASAQGTRVMFDNLRDRPAETTFRIMQSAAMLTAIPAAASIALLGALRPDDEPEEDKELSNTELYLKAMRGISKYERSNYNLFFTGGRTEDGEFDYIRVAKTHQLTPFLTLAESIQRETMKKMVGDNSESTLIEDMDFVINNNILPLETSITGNVARVPMIKAVMTYSTGYDFFREQDLSYLRGDVPVVVEGFESNAVEDFYKKIGLEAGVSPARFKGAVESFITSPSTTPYVGIMYGGLDAMASDKDGKVIMEKLGKDLLKSTKRRVKKETSEFNRRISTNEKMQKKFEKIEIESIMTKQKFTELAKKYAAKEISIKEVVPELLEVYKESPFEGKRMVNKFKDVVKNQGVSPYVFEVKYANKPKQRALMLVQLFGSDLITNNNLKKDRQGLRLQMFQHKAINKETLVEYQKLIQETE